MNGNILFTKQISWGKIRIKKWVNKYTHVDVLSTSYYYLFTKDKNFKDLLNYK